MAPTAAHCQILDGKRLRRRLPWRFSVSQTSSAKIGAKIKRRVQVGKLNRMNLEIRVKKALGREHLAEFVVVTMGGSPTHPTFTWKVDPARRRELERTRLGRRVLCTTRKLWSTERIVHAFRGQWNVEELFRRSKDGGVVPWGPSYQWADASLQLHTFATVLGLTLVALAKLAFGAKQSTKAFMQELADIKVTLVRTNTGEKGRRPTVLLPPVLSSMQRKAVRIFKLDRWVPILSSTMDKPPLSRG
jgi:transposase